MFQNGDQHSSVESSLTARAGITTKGYLMKSSLFWTASLSPSLTTLCQILMVSLSPSPTIFCHLFQMESISPFPILSIQSSIISDEWKFMGTLVFNHLPPSDHEKHTNQSTSSGLRRLNRGSCCTPKFAISYFSKIFLLHRWSLTFA